LDLRIKSYGCLKFLGEVWVGRAYAGANEEELTKHQKIWGQGEGGKEAGGLKNGAPVGVRLAAADRAPTRSHQPLSALPHGRPPGR
jgi:hypothetical protein